VGARELIVDVGMHTGRDAEFYLRKGFDVVAIEADADLARAASERLAGWVTAGQLTIREVAIAPHDGEVRFFANPGHDDWGTIREKVMRRNERQGEPSEARTVPAMRFERVLDELGRVPYYVKIDIEGADQLCLDALGSCERPPPYVSVETSLDSREEARRQFTTLRDFGYEAFKIVNQRLNAHYVCPDPPREGEFVPVRFDTLMSGPFGEETPGPWLSFDKAWRHYRGILVEQRMFGISGLLGTTPLARVYSGMRRRLLGAPVGWYDLHARHADSKRC
jgi:FkbM family methyltransferase